MDMQQRYVLLGIGRKCTWTIISSIGSFDIVMKGRKFAVGQTGLTEMQCLRTCYHQRTDKRWYSVWDKMTCLQWSGKICVMYIDWQIAWSIRKW